jgi:hypothetical protein
MASQFFYGDICPTPPCLPRLIIVIMSAAGWPILWRSLPLRAELARTLWMFRTGGYGLMSKTGPMSFIALLFGALAVATGDYLILDLNSPYSGLFRASSAPLDQVLAYMDKGQGAFGGSR